MMWMGRWKVWLPWGCLEGDDGDELMMEMVYNGNICRSRGRLLGMEKFSKGKLVSSVLSCLMR